MSLVQTRYENIPAVLKYAIFGSGPLTVLGGVEVKQMRPLCMGIESISVAYVCACVSKMRGEVTQLLWRFLAKATTAKIVYTSFLWPIHAAIPINPE